MENQKPPKTKVPTLYEAQLLTPLIKGKRRILDIKQPYIIAFTGPRGSGKSESLSYAAALAKAAGLRVWLNYPMAFNLVKYDGTKEYVETELLNFNDLLTLSPSFRGGFIGIDEYQDWASAYMFHSIKNRLLSAMWAQIRKNELSFYYVSKKFRWVDVKTRDETDIEINCMDAAKTPSDFGKHQEGEVIYWNIKDLSGNWTGYMFEDWPIIRSKRLYAKPMWNSYNTNERFDVFEAMRGVNLNLEKLTIGDNRHGDDGGDGGSAPITDYRSLKRAIQQVFDVTPRIRPIELWQTLNITETRDMENVIELMKDLGIKKRGAQGKNYYVKTGAYK